MCHVLHVYRCTLTAGSVALMQSPADMRGRLGATGPLQRYAGGQLFEHGARAPFCGPHSIATSSSSSTSPSAAAVQLRGGTTHRHHHLPWQQHSAATAQVAHGDRGRHVDLAADAVSQAVLSGSSSSSAEACQGATPAASGPSTAPPCCRLPSLCTIITTSSTAILWQHCTAAQHLTCWCLSISMFFTLCCLPACLSPCLSVILPACPPACLPPCQPTIAAGVHSW